MKRSFTIQPILSLLFLIVLSGCDKNDIVFSLKHQDYFPIENNSEWQYNTKSYSIDNELYSSDTTTIKTGRDTTFGNKVYKVLTYESGYNHPVRKEGTAYYRKTQNGEEKFLDESFGIGSLWVSIDSKRFKTEYAITEKNTIKYVNGVLYANVIVVEETNSAYYLNKWDNISHTQTWYAKGVGEIYSRSVSLIYYGDSRRSLINYKH
jgi:hypothetical protein